MYTEELQEVKLNSYNIIFSSHAQLLDKQYMEVLNGAKKKKNMYMDGAKSGRPILSRKTEETGWLY